MQVITRTASTRVAKYAFEYARDNNRKKVTAVHKANIMKAADGLFLECCRETSLEYPDILYNEMIVDNTCMQVRWPSCRATGSIRRALPTCCLCQGAPFPLTGLIGHAACIQPCTV